MSVFSGEDHTGPVKGITVLNGNLIIAANTYEFPYGVGFYKYNTSFQYVGKSSDSTGSMGDAYDSSLSLVTDETNLIIGNGYEFCNGYSACYRVTKFSKGDL